MKVIDTQQMSLSIDGTTWVSEASTLGFRPGDQMFKRVYDAGKGKIAAMDVSHNGKTYLFHLVNEARHDGDTLYWELVPTKHYPEFNYKIKIFND